jgi:hypothetical protein
MKRFYLEAKELQKETSDEKIDEATLILKRFKVYLLANPEYDDDYAISILVQTFFHIGKIAGRLEFKDKLMNEVAESLISSLDLKTNDD